MGEKTEKRVISPELRALLNFDVALTNKFCAVCERFMSFRSLRSHYKLLENSCHGILWLAGWLVFIWISDNPSLYQMQVNFYLGLLLDIVIVAVIKAITRRRRPAGNTPDMIATIGPDVFAFPSGHATRSTFIATYFIYLAPVPIIMQLPLIAWCAAVSISRVLLRRHHLLDVTAGVLIGMCETALIAVFWLGQGASAWIVTYFDGSSSV